MADQTTTNVRGAQNKRRMALIERIGTVADLASEKPLKGELGDVAYDLLRQAAAQISSDRLLLASLPAPVPAAAYDADAIERLQRERNRFRGALLQIKYAAEDGRICDDVAWFSQHETLFDYIEGTLETTQAAVGNLFQGALRDCPFCGGKAIRRDDPGVPDVPFGLVVDHQPGCFLGFRDLQPDAVIDAAWNARASVVAPAAGEAVAWLNTLRDSFMTAQSIGHPDPSERSYRLIFSFPNMDAMHAAHAAMVHAFRRAELCSTGASDVSATGDVATATDDTPQPPEQCANIAQKSEQFAESAKCSEQAPAMGGGAVDMVAKIIDPSAWENRADFQAIIAGTYERIPTDPAQREMYVRSATRRVDTCVGASRDMARSILAALATHSPDAGGVGEAAQIVAWLRSEADSYAGGTLIKGALHGAAEKIENGKHRPGLSAGEE